MSSTLPTGSMLSLGDILIQELMKFQCGFPPVQWESEELVRDKVCRLLCVFIFCVVGGGFLRQGLLIHSRFTSNSLGSLVWLWTYSPPCSDSWVLGLLGCTTAPAWTLILRVMLACYSKADQFLPLFWSQKEPTSWIVQAAGQQMVWW